MYNQYKIFRVLQLISLLKSKPAKSIRQLSIIIDSTERTIYRYLDLLSEVGFVIERTDRNQVFIESTKDDLQFREEEIQFIKSLVLTVGKQNPLKDSILKKLNITSENQINSQQILNAHLGKIIETLSSAIQLRNQVVLKKYHSINSNNITDRLVEPIKFTDNYQSLAAFEVNTGKNKYFNIERITSVEIKKRVFQYTDKHKYKTPDVFGFSESKNQFEIELLMSLRASVLLKEEYPMTTPLIKYNPKKKKYDFKVIVNDLKPISRFVLGFIDEIEVIGSSLFIQYLKDKVEKITRHSVV